jgi:hypothetical protein
MPVLAARIGIDHADAGSLRTWIDAENAGHGEMS